MSEQLFTLGFTNLNSENNTLSLEVEGHIPSWINGTLFRNGPAKFTNELGWHTHWFDGLAMIHKFTIDDSKVNYSNRFLRTKAYELAMTTGEMASGFGTAGGKQINGGNNTNVNISKIDNRFVAMTETPAVIEFNPANLDTVGVLKFDDTLDGPLTTAHPQIDPLTGRFINFTVQFGKTSMYHLYSIGENSRKRELLCSIPTDEPAYIHSFANTENYVVLAEFPLVVNPYDLMNSQKPFIENFRWKREQGTRFYVVRKSDGKLVKTFESEAFFSFHHVNAYEYAGGLILDICASRTPDIIGNLQVSKLTDKESTERNPVELRRYDLSFSSNFANYSKISAESIDLPTYNSTFSGIKYRYAYGISTNKLKPEKYANQLVKVDTSTGESKIWCEAACYPGEPIFIRKPQSTTEDDGVVVSVVLDGLKNRSFLLFLEAQSFHEIGRAVVPHHIPFGFHGIFTEELFHPFNNNRSEKNEHRSSLN